MEQRGGTGSTHQSPKNLTKIKGKIFVQQSHGESAPGWGAASVKLHSSSEINPHTGNGKLSGSSSLTRGKTEKNRDGVKVIEYRVKFSVESDFGIPGAFRITNMHKLRFFLQSAEFLDASSGSWNIRFYCHSWVYPYQQTKTDRLFFSNTSYLPSSTPKGLVKLREEELATLRGDGIEELAETKVRIYDYDDCNDVGDPNMPYHRRGRPHERSHSKQEGFKLDDIYVPPDERLSPKEMSELIPNSIQAFVHFLLPEAQLWLDDDTKSKVPSDKKMSEEPKSNSKQATSKAKSSSDKDTNEKNNFENFKEILEMYKNSSRNPVKGSVAEKLKSWVKDDDIFKKIVRASKKKQTKECPKPQIVADTYEFSETGMAWEEDEEFARQMLAGTNPVVIRRLDYATWEKMRSSVKKEEIAKILHKLIRQQAIDEETLKTAINKEASEPISYSKLDGLADEKMLEPITDEGFLKLITDKEILKPITDKEILKPAIENNKVFILDHLSYLMPVLKKMQEQKEATPAYASQTLLFLKKNNTLTPLAIELVPFTDKGEENRRVFYPSDKRVEGAMWQMAKTHVAVNDSCHHHLISHWLKTHAVVEPFIIATRRQLSAMHPIHRLLAPHFKGTMHVNALARSVLINPGGILEKILATGKFSMELSSEVYKNDWKFDEQGLPKDLLKRGMALEDPKKPAGVRLLFEDYPYAADGLDIWVAIKNLVTRFCSHIYTDDKSIKSDNELQEWWKEIWKVGHRDKKDEKMWCQMTTLDDLTQTLTTLIWTASALHAAVNFGQYAYAGYPPNRPTLCRNFIPMEGTQEYQKFLANPDKYHLQMLPNRFVMKLSAALVQVLSEHSSEEVYLGQGSPEEWTDNKEIQNMFTKFGEELLEVEKRISERNRNRSLKNRGGPAKIMYTLLQPDTSNDGFKGGLTGKGVPNSISI